MKKNILGSFREKAGVTRKTAISAISAVLAVALIATVAFGFIPDTAIKASAESIGLISSASGKNYLPDTYTAVNVPAGTYTMTEADYAANTPQPSDNGVAAFDFHIFAKNFASKAHTCGNIAVENLGAPTAGATGAPEFGSRPNHDTTSIKLSYVENISDWSTSAQADAFVFGPNNSVTEKAGQVFVETPSGKYMMGNGKALMDKTYIDDATPFIDIDAELTEAENYQRYLVWLMEDIRSRGDQYRVEGWGIAMEASNGEMVRVLTHPDVAGWGWMGTTIDFSKYPEDTIIVDLDLYESVDWWTGKTNVGSNAQNLINGSVTLKGTAGKRIIFNVESSSGFNADNIKFADTNMKADKMGNSEDSVKLDNNILWNFYNRDSGVPKSTSGTITVGGTWMGSILAPNATVKCSAGLNGSIIAKNVTTSAETHKSDYTGEKVTKSDETSIKVTKIWQNDDPNTRPAEITVRLLQNGKAIKTVQLSTANKTADGTWEYTFDKLPVTDGRGTSYRYDIEEVVPKGYTCNIVNNTIINTGKGEKPKLGSLTFNKRPEGDATKFLKDAEFKLTIDTGASLAGVTATGVSNFKATDGAVTWTSTDSAAVFSNLPYGKYTITETKAPAGYVTSNPVTVKVDGPAAAKADMTDKQISIKLAKLEGKNNEFLPGATMELTPNWGTSLANVKVEGVTTTSHDANKITWTSGKNAVTIKGIPAGSYTLTETNAPMGYDKAAPMTFIVEADGTVKVNSAAVSRVDMINNLTPEVIKTYTINIGKKDAAGSSVDGAVLKLTSVNGSDLSKVTVDGQEPRLSDGNKSITWTSGSTPAVFANLPAGSYTLTEVTAPAGYKLAGQMSITVSADGQSFDMIDEAIEMTISKQDSETYKELAGATLKLESDKELTGVVVTGAKKDTVNKSGKTITWVTDGSAVSFSKLPAGSYTLTEIGVPAGYMTAVQTKFEIDAEGKVNGTNAEGTNFNGNTCTIYDVPVTVKIGKQYDNNGDKGVLSGAVLQLTGVNGGNKINLSGVNASIALEHPDAYTVTWSSGAAANSIKGLPDGTYTLHEIEAPEGFDRSEDIQFVVSGGVIESVKQFVVNSDGTSGWSDVTLTGDTVTMTDKKTQFYSMVLTKIDADKYIKENTVQIVKDATLAIFDENATSFAAEEAIRIIKTTDEVTNLMLPDGKYVLVELEAPAGYEKTNNKVRFEVNNGTLEVKSLDPEELAVATTGNPKDAGLAADVNNAYYTLETSGIFERYGEYPESISFTLGDGTEQYVCSNFTLYKEGSSKELIKVIENTTNTAPANSWEYSVGNKMTDNTKYEQGYTYYAVVQIKDSTGTRYLGSDEIGSIKLNLNYLEIENTGSVGGTFEGESFNGKSVALSPDYNFFPKSIKLKFTDANGNPVNVKVTQCTLVLERGQKSQAIGTAGSAVNGGRHEFRDVEGSEFEAALNITAEYNENYNYWFRCDGFYYKILDEGVNESDVKVTLTLDYGVTGNTGGTTSGDAIDVGGNFGDKIGDLGSGGKDGITSDSTLGQYFESKGGVTAYVVLPNYNTPEDFKNKFSVELIKTDASGTKIQNNSASFVLYDEDDKLVTNLVQATAGVDGVYKYDASATADTMYNTEAKPLKTAADGTLTVNGLNLGTYNFYEVKAPSGYEKIEDAITFVLNLNHTEDNPKEITVKNTLKKGDITLIKTDDNGVLKEGASFDLYRVKLESINSSNPTGEYVGTYTTLNDGKYTVEVDLGYLYYAIEKTAPDGTTNTNVTNATIFPQLATTGMDATRYVINGHNITYGVVLTEDIGTGNVKIQTATGLDEAGNIIYADKVNYEVDADGKSTGVVKGMDVYEGSIGAENTAIDTTIAKIDETGAALAGATLKLEANGKAAGYVKSVFAEVTGTIAFEHRIEYVYTTNAKGETILSTDADDRPYIKSEYITWTSGDAANVLSGLPAGEYTLTELDAPEGYAVASPVTVTAGGSVTMTDKPLTGEITLKKNDALTNAVIAGVDFTLQVSDDGTTWTDTDKTCTTGADGTAKVTGLTYGKYYRFKETSTPAGYEANTGDAVYTDSVQITEDNLTSSVIRFENTAKTGKITLEKVEAGNADAKIKDAVFELYYKASTANDSTYILYPGAATYTTNENGQIVVDNLPWGYTYKFKEVGTPIGYVESNAETAPLVLTASELEKTVTVENTKLVASLNLTGTKTITGKNGVSEQFDFAIMENGKDVVTVKNVGGNITFPAITYTYENIGDHTYTIYEKEYKANGITHDKSTYTLVVNVALTDGELVVTQKSLKKGDADATSIAFVNTYTASGIEATVEGTKTLNGKALTDGAFTFELIETGADFNTANKTAETTTNLGTAFSFTKNYTAAGTHYYVIKEQIPAETKGIAYDTAEYRWTVVVEDNGTGNLVVKSKTLTKNDAVVADGKAAFTNTYTAAGTNATIEGVKTLNGKTLTDGAFTFELIETGADFNTADKTAKTTTNTGTAFSFTENYTAAGTHYYVVKEQIPAETKGIAYDTAEYRWTVVVEDNGTGNLVVKSKTLTTKDGAAVESGKAAFTNTYTAASVTATIKGTKTLDGKAPAAEAFTFELWSAKDEGGKYVADRKLKEFKNGADGKFTVETDELTAEGTYYFIVKEAIPEGAVRDVYNGITYDNSEYLWTVTVADNGTGNLVASKAVDAESGEEMVLEFANTTARETVKFSKKVAGGGNELPGATIEIAPVGSITFDDSVTVSVENAEKTATKITWVSGRDAVEISGLPVGTYTMTETAAPAGYAMAPEVIYFRIADDGTIYSVPASEYKADGTTAWKAVTNDTVIMEDAPYTSVFSKEAADGGNELAGAKLSIKPIGTVNLSNVILPDDDVRIVNGAITWTSTTEPKTIGALPNGVYEFTETQAPQGYEIAETIYVKIDGDKVYSVIGDAYTGETTVWGDAAEGDKVIMVDNVNQAVFSKQAMTSEDELPGAVLTLKLLNTDATLNSVIRPTGVTLLSDNRTLTWRSDDESKVIGKLPDGIYEFTEIAAPSGYEKAETIYVLIDGGDVYSVTKAVYDSAEGTVEWGNPVSGDKIVMKDDYNKAVFSKQATNAGGELPGAKLTLTPVVSTTDISKVKVPEGVDNEDGVISWTSGEEEVIIGWLPDGVYKFTEVTAPSGYEVAETIYVKIDNGGVYSVPESSYDEEDTVWSAAEDGDKVIMKDAPNSLVISKQAVGGGSELVGAKLTLTPVVSTTDIDKVIVPDGVDNEDGVISWTSGKQAVTLNMVPDGVYKFTEVQAPDKYDIAETIYIKVENGEIFSVNESDYDGEDTLWGIAAAEDRVIMLDALTPAPNEAKFEFTKYTDAGFTISGAVFKLTGSNGYSRAVTSGSTGKVAFDGMTEGTYTLVETAAPQKFIKSSAAVYITVDAEGKMVIKNEEGTEITIADVEVLMTNKVIPIEDEKKGKEGDVFDLYTELIKNNKEYEDITITWESSDDSVASVDANGKVTLKKPGTATITAKSGDTVLGTFVLGAEAQAPVDDDAPPYTGDTDAPQTGDYAVGWTIALSAILLASGATAKISYDAIKRRRNARAK